MSPPFAGSSPFAFSEAIAVIVVDAAASEVVAVVEPVLLLVQGGKLQGIRNFASERRILYDSIFPTHDYPGVCNPNPCLQSHQFHPRLLRRATLVHNGDTSG